MDTIERERPEFYEALGRTIQVLRTDQGLDRKDLAERAGISYSYLAAIENGKKPPSSKVLFSIAEALGLRSHELLASTETRWERTRIPEPLPEAYTQRLPRFAAPSRRREWFHGATDETTVEPSQRATYPPLPYAADTPQQRAVPRSASGWMLQLQELSEHLTDEDRELVLDLAKRLAERRS